METRFIIAYANFNPNPVELGQSTTLTVIPLEVTETPYTYEPTSGEWNAGE